MVNLWREEGRVCSGEDEGGEKEGAGEEEEGVAPLSNINTDGNHLCLKKRTGPHSAKAEPMWSFAQPIGCS